MPSEQQDTPRAMGPCPMALAAMTVPARRWATRADLIAQLVLAEKFMSSCALDKFTVEEAAKQAGLSIDHFIKLFREVYRETPYQHFAKRRVEKAKELLKETDLPVGDIGYQVGFEDASAFARHFRKLVGMSPTMFRRSASSGTPSH